MQGDFMQKFTICCVIMRRDIMMKAPRGSRNWSGSQRIYRTHRKLRVLSFDLKVRLSDISGEELFQNKGAGSENSPLASFKLWLQRRAMSFCFGPYKITPRGQDFL